MADPNLLAQILAGQDPLAAQMLQGYQGSQLSSASLNPEFGHNEGILGGVGKTLAAFLGHDMTNNAVQGTTQARIAAQPELARLLAQPDPYATAGQNPEAFSPVALSRLTNATPEQVAQTREAAARAAFLGAQANLANRTGQPGPPMYGAVPQATAARPVGAPAVGAPALPGSGRYPQPQAAVGPEGADPITQAATMSPQQRQAMLQNPQARAQLLLKLRALAAVRQQPPAQVGGANAVRPQP